LLLKKPFDFLFHVDIIVRSSKSDPMVYFSFVLIAVTSIQSF
jgi:hypothetical protein